MKRSPISGLRMVKIEPAVYSLCMQELKPVSNAFVCNVEDLHALLVLPLGLTNVALWEANRVRYLERAVSARFLARQKAESPEDREILISKAQRNWDKAIRQGKVETARAKMVDAAASLLCNLNNNPRMEDFRFAMRALFYGSVASGWGLFECVARDSWVEMLNAYPEKLVQGALIKAQGEDIFKGKQVSVGLLARYDFEVRNRMGDILASKFDFSGISGIRAAYAAAFGREDKIEQALADPQLGRLEATRHLIVHRAGWIDDEYRHRVAGSSLKSKRLSLSGKEVSLLTNAAVRAGASLLIALDSWSLQFRTAHRKKSKRSTHNRS